MNEYQAVDTIGDDGVIQESKIEEEPEEDMNGQNGLLDAEQSSSFHLFSNAASTITPTQSSNLSI